jgi:serine/threonine protein kinase
MTEPGKAHDFFTSLSEKKILEVVERYDEVNGRFPLTGIVVVYRFNNVIFHTLVQGVRKPPANELQRLVAILPDHGTVIPPESYAPLFPTDGSLLKAPNLLPANTFIKRPRLTGFDRNVDQGHPNAIAEAIMSEAKVCQILRHNPHPNIAEYRGCEVSREGRITGLCWNKLGDSLMQRVNPNFYGKGIFKCNPGILDGKDSILDKVKAGIRHLHRLGLVHNDINPTNIMFDKDDNPVIIDFDSCTPIGQSLKGVGRTYQWFDEDVCIATPSNDLDALEEICEWLSEGRPKNFHFEA